MNQNEQLSDTPRKTNVKVEIVNGVLEMKVVPQDNAIEEL